MLIKSKKVYRKILISKQNKTADAVLFFLLQLNVQSLSHVYYCLKNLLNLFFAFCFCVLY